MPLKATARGGCVEDGTKVMVGLSSLTAGLHWQGQVEVMKGAAEEDDGSVVIRMIKPKLKPGGPAD
jgi:hypothetical protein